MQKTLDNSRMTTSVLSRHNPYVIGPPVRNQAMFFGREELFQFIADNLRKHASVILLHGQRRIGKSSVLRQIPAFVGMEDEFFFFRYDLQDQARLPLAQVLRNLAIDLRDQLGEKLIVTLPTLDQLRQDPYRYVSDFLPRVYRAIGDRKLVLLLDEFDVLSNYTDEAAGDHFFPFLQSIIRRTERLVIIPVVGRRLDEIPTLISLFRDAPSQEIGLLDERSARRLITKPVSDWLTYSEEAIEAILELSAGHPYFTQLICYVLCAQAKTDERDRIERADVEGSIAEALISGGGGLAWFRDGLPTLERVFFSAVAEGEVSAPAVISARLPNPAWMMLTKYGVVQTERLLAAQERLEKWNYTTRYAEHVKRARDGSSRTNTYHRVMIKLVREWLRKQHPLQRAILDLEQADEQAQRLYQKALQAREAGAAQTAVEVPQEALAANPNHFSALFELADATLEMGDFSEAVGLFERAHKVDPSRTTQGYLQALLSDAKVRMQHKQYEKALDDFDRALKLAPEEEDARQGFKEAEAALRRRLASHNPFTLSPVSHTEFIGRQGEIASIFSKIRHREHVALFGPAGIGKSSLLRYIASPETWRKQDLDPESAVVVFFNCESLMPFTKDAFWRGILKLAGEKEPSIEPEIKTILQHSLIEDSDLRRLLAKIAAQDKYLVLLLDDFDQALRPNEQYTESDMLIFLSKFRNLSVQGEMATVITTRRRMSELGPPPAGGSPWWNHYVFQEIKSFTDSELEALMARMPSEFSLAEDEKEWVRRSSDGSPYLQQAAFELLYRHHASEEPFNLEKVRQEFEPVKSAFLKNQSDVSTN